MRFIAGGALAALIGTSSTTSGYHIDLTRYFASATREAESRSAVFLNAKAFAASSTPATAGALLRWLTRYDRLLKALERHDIYVYLRAEEDSRDIADAKADDQLGETEDLISSRLIEAAGKLGASRIGILTGAPALRPYRYLLVKALAQGSRRLSIAQARSVALAVTPALDSAAATYKALRKSNATVSSNQDAYAALLVTIATLRNGVAQLRGFPTAADASLFDKSIDPASVNRVLAAVRASGAYARYLDVAAKRPKLTFSPPPITIDHAIPLILAAEQPMGGEYTKAYAELLDPRNRRVEICTAPLCDDDGFSVGFGGVDSAVYYGGFSGTTDSIRALAHESGHAVHRQLMSLDQPIAAYNRAPSFIFESFAIFNELLLLDHLYQTATNQEKRAYYLNAFLDDATFQVYGSAQQTELESAIYRGINNGTIRTAADFNALTTAVFSRYDSRASANPETSLAWARNRLFFTDPLYDANYLYAGLLALSYFAAFERDPQAFSVRYVALLRNGFNDTPARLERRFLGIDIAAEPSLVSNAQALIEARTQTLANLYSGYAQTR